MRKKTYIKPFLRCVITYEDISTVRVLHYAVDCDYVDPFTAIILDTFVHPVIKFTDILFSYDNRQFFQLI